MNDKETKKTGNRYNQGKLSWNLVDFKSLTPLIRTLEFGARKYSKIIVPLLEKDLKKWNVKFVKKPLSLQEKCVKIVMTNGSKMSIQVKGKDSLKIRESIEKIIKKKLTPKKENVVNKNIKTQTTLDKEEIITTSKNMELLQKNLIYVKNKDVKYVEKKNLPCKQIITMKLKNSEVYCVVDAITDLDSLETLVSFLNPLLNICLNSNDYIESGKHNWKKGLNKTEILESIMRHLTALMDGELNDPESNQLHMGHIMCNAMFWVHFHNKKLKE